MPKGQAPNILLYDVEMSFNVSYHYDQWGVNIPYTHIKHRQFMICAAWKWYGEKKVHHVSVLDDPARFKKDFRDDYFVIKTLRDLVDKADAVVAYNGKRFDNKELNTGIIKHGLEPVHEYLAIDPCQMARSKFRFKGGNSLANLGKFFGLDDQKSSLALPDWIDATEGCPKAIKKTIKYNIKDINPMQGVWERIRPFCKDINMNLYVNTEDGVCRSCGGSNLSLAKKRKTTGATLRYQYQCQDCGGYTTFAKAIKSSKFR